MSTNTKPRETDTSAVQLAEETKQLLWKLLSQVCVHLVTAIPWLLGCIDVIARAGAEIDRIVFTRDSKAACSTQFEYVSLFDPNVNYLRGDSTGTGVWVDDGYPSLACSVLEKPLLGTIIRRTGKPGQVHQHRYFFVIVRLGMRRQVKVQ